MRGLTGSLLALLAALAFASASALAGLGSNPADHKSLVDKPIEDYQYDPAKRCTKHVPPGTKAMVGWLEHNTEGELWGIGRCEKLSPGNFSLHAENRAIDWHMDARDKNMKRQAMRLIKERLLGADRRGNENALARRMGVQGIIYDCRAWWSGPGGLEDYSYCFKNNGKREKNIDPTAAHVDHIHIELNLPGSRKKTSFWRSKLWK